MITFKQFLTEAFRAIPVNYGTDGKNRQWNISKDYDGKYCYTFFSISPMFHVRLSINADNEVAFKTKHGEFSTDSTEYSMDSTGTINGAVAVKLTNCLLYMLLQMRNQLHIKDCIFYGATVELQRLYLRIFTDKNVQNNFLVPNNISVEVEFGDEEDYAIDRHGNEVAANQIILYFN